MKFQKREWLQIIILAVPFIAAAILWDKLPDRMAIHWGIKGQPDGYVEKTFASFFLPCLNIAVWLLVLVLPRFDPKLSRYDDETKTSLRRTFALIRLAITTFLTAMALGILLAPIWPVVHVPVIACAGVGLLLAVLGNLMSKVRQNWICGFRNPWTLESREVWTKTHRLGGRLMMATGLCIFVFGLVFPMNLLFLCVLILAIALIAIVPMVYSYVLSKRLPR